MEFLADLNHTQRRAALAPPGPLLVLAGPGTGKTRTLVARIQSLIEHYHIRPDRVLAVTYTNKAAEEMRERLRISLGERAHSLQVCTFHAFCIGVLREWHEKAGVAKHFTIADEDCQLRVMSRVAPMLAGERSVRYLLGRLSGTRLNPAEMRPLTAMEQQLERRYKLELRKNCLLDFDDILFHTEQLFFQQPSVLNRYCRTFDAILIDEFQDTDRVQYEIIKQLVNVHSNIFVVADDDQSIFSWRGANPGNIDLFRRDFACDLIVLTENYRSYPEILTQAQLLIEQNPRLADKRLQAIRKQLQTSLETIRVEHFATDYEEAAFIIKEVRRQMERDSRLRYADFAVLYARHSVGEFLEREMMKANLPCQLVRGRSCFDQPEIVRTMHLLRVLYNPKDQISLEEFVAKEVDEMTYLRLKALQREEALSDFRTALDRFRKRSWVPEQERRQIERVIGLISNLMSFKANAQGKRLSDLFAEILNSLSDQEVLTLSAYADKLTDPIFYSNLRKAAQALYEARTTHRPVLLSITDQHLRFLAIEMLKRALGITVYSMHNFVVQQLTSEKSPEKQQTDLPPLLIALDGVELHLATDTLRYCQGIIYLGTDYTPKLRELLLAFDALVLNPEELSVSERGFESSAVAALFKLCQATSWLGTAEFLADYVALDIETTDREVETTDIIEVAAVRVRNGIPGEHFHTLVKPTRPISVEATKVHGFTEADLADAPLFNEIVDRLLEFLGQDVLLAHNGYNFDFPCINRKLREVGRRKLENRTFDTLPMASRLYPDRGASLDALASAFNIDTGQRHRAYDDTITLIEIFERLKKEYASHLRRTACEQCLDLAAAGMVLEQGRLADAHSILIKEGLIRLAAPGSTLLERLAEHNGELGLLRTLAEEARAEQFRAGNGSAERFAAFVHFNEIVSRFDNTESGENSLEQSIEAFLDFVGLYQQQDSLRRRNAINLMTIYASKGLEFDRVFIVGLEQNMIPSFYAIESRDAEQLAEQRRLLYVAITRAKDQLIFTTVATRNGYPQIVSEFLSELSLQ
ncbi:MAG: UvrD-helicase domain-containing protein [Acidobacteriota bacterium]